MHRWRRVGAWVAVVRLPRAATGAATAARARLSTARPLWDEVKKGGGKPDVEGTAAQAAGEAAAVNPSPQLASAQTVTPKPRKNPKAEKAEKAEKAIKPPAPTASDSSVDLSALLSALQFSSSKSAGETSSMVGGNSQKKKAAGVKKNTRANNADLNLELPVDFAALQNTAAQDASGADAKMAQDIASLLSAASRDAGTRPSSAQAPHGREPMPFPTSIKEGPSALGRPCSSVMKERSVCLWVGCYHSMGWCHFALACTAVQLTWPRASTCNASNKLSIPC
jgi:hypothetical protein